LLDREPARPVSGNFLSVRFSSAERGLVFRDTGHLPVVASLLFRTTADLSITAAEDFPRLLFNTKAPARLVVDACALSPRFIAGGTIPNAFHPLEPLYGNRFWFLPQGIGSGCDGGNVLDAAAYGGLVTGNNA